MKYPLQTVAAGAPWLFGLAFDAPLIGVSQRWPNTLHAVEMEAVVDGAAGRGTFTSACGMSRLRLLKVGEVVGLWPPGVRGAPVGLTRCAECFVAGSKKRPRMKWRLSEGTDEPKEKTK